MWELEERHLQEKHQLFKQQLKDQYFMQRHQLLKRHEKVCLVVALALVFPSHGLMFILQRSLTPLNFFPCRRWSKCSVITSD